MAIIKAIVGHTAARSRQFTSLAETAATPVDG